MIILKYVLKSATDTHRPEINRSSGSQVAKIPGFCLGTFLWKPGLPCRTCIFIVRCAGLSGMAAVVAQFFMDGGVALNKQNNMKDQEVYLHPVPRPGSIMINGIPQAPAAALMIYAVYRPAWSPISPITTTTDDLAINATIM